jgi:hypothetical protein
MAFGWSPDSATLLYEDEPAMGALDVRSASRHRILFEEAEHSLWGGRFSPDGRWIALGAATGASWRAAFCRVRRTISRPTTTDWQDRVDSAGRTWGQLVA